MLNRNAEKETINILLQENKRLKRENQKLRESLNELDRYKSEYEELNKQLQEMRTLYACKLEDFDKMESEYKKELQKIIKNKTQKLK